MGLWKQYEAGSSSNALRSLPREDTPLLPSGAGHRKRSSQFKTFANVFISIVGAGVLGLPYTFMRTGWITGVVMVFVVAALTYYGMMLLVRTRHRLADSPAKIEIASFGDLGFVVSGSVGRLLVDSMIVLSQAGFCVGYLIFIGDTLANLFNFSSYLTLEGRPKIWGLYAKTLYIWSCFPFQLALNSISSLTLLAPLSVFADAVDLGAMGVVIFDDILIFLKNRPEVHAFGTISTFFYGLGVIAYSFEGVGMALPLELEMKERAKFGKTLGLAMLFISAMYGAFGATGYFAFGEDTKDIITSNMSKGLLSTLIQSGLCVNLFFTFPLMMNPVHEIFERRFSNGDYCLWMRWVLVLSVSLVALFVPNFADFLSLVGSSTCCVLGFVLPALFHYLAFKESMTWRQASVDLGIMTLGIFLGVMGTWYSLLEIFAMKVQGS